MTRIRPSNRASIRHKRFLILYGVVAIVFIFMLTPIFRARTLSYPTPLPVPSIATTSSAGMLTIRKDISDILGASTIDATEFLDAINGERAKKDAPALRYHPLLAKAAQMRADVIIRYENFSHGDPYEGKELGTVLPMVGYRFIYATENIGMGGSSGKDFVFGFMNSTAHRENLLDPTLMDTGVGFSHGRYGPYTVNIAVQLFAIPGGKYEHLGYMPEDIGAYEQMLKDTKEELDPLTWTIGKLLKEPSYTEERFRNLTERKALLSDILTKMHNEKPLDADDAGRILAYNRSITQAF